MDDWSALVTCANHQMRIRMRVMGVYHGTTIEKQAHDRKQADLAGMLIIKSACKQI